jgi:hypothetical protein
VRHGDPAGAAHADIGQSRASTRRKSSSLTPEVFHVCVPRGALFATTYETVAAQGGRVGARCFISDHL